MYEDKIEKDELDRVIYQERSDGFREYITYNEDGSKKIETHYPDGQIEIEKFGEKSYILQTKR